MPNKYDLSVVIINFNSFNFLESCLRSLDQQQGIKLQIIVVDNHSTDNSVAQIKSQFPKLKLIVLDHQVGFAAANNIAIPLVEADHLLFLNPDTKMLASDDLKLCLDKYRSLSKVGAFTCRVNLATTGELDATCHRGFPTPWASLTHFSGLSKLFSKSKFFGQYLMSYLNLDTTHSIDAIGGMFFLISFKAGDAVGWWDEDYYFYGEDLDFCYRLKQQGFQNYYWPKVSILHYKGASTGMNKKTRKLSSASKATTRQVRNWSIEAMKIFYSKHYRSKYPFFINWLVILGINLLAIKRTKLT